MCGGITKNTNLSKNRVDAYPAWVVLWTYDKPVTVPNPNHPLLPNFNRVLKFKNILIENAPLRDKRRWEVAIWYCKLGLEAILPDLVDESWIVNVYKIGKKRKPKRKRPVVYQENYLVCGG